MGTGPFSLKSWKPGRSWEVVKNSSYWQPEEPLLDGVRAIQVKELSTIVQSVASGQSTLANIDAASLPVVQANPDLKTTSAEGVQFISAVMDTRVEPFTDNRVREAMKLALDRATVMKIGFANQCVVAADSTAPANDSYFTPELEARTKMDRAAAEKLMAEAGYPNGIDLTFKVLGDPAYVPFGPRFRGGTQGLPVPDHSEAGTGGNLLGQGVDERLLLHV